MRDEESDVNGSPIERLLRPRSVAIVGASATPGAPGASVLANLQRMGYRGDIHLINPNRPSMSSGSKPVGGMCHILSRVTSLGLD